MTSRYTDLVTALRSIAIPLHDAKQAHTKLFEYIGNARFVFLGSGTHGTQEFYIQRAAITKMLIQEKQFTVIVAEADYPDAHQINNYIKRIDQPDGNLARIDAFKRFPTWLWRNTVIAELIDWLKAYNKSLKIDDFKVGFYGLDLYSLNQSMHEVINFLTKVDPVAAEQARMRYSCFDTFGNNVIVYGNTLGANSSCQLPISNQLYELQLNSINYIRPDVGLIDEDAYFYAEQNGRIAKDAEAYYRAVFTGPQTYAWNLRTQHMAETVQALVAHLEKQHSPLKIIVWAHNAHIAYNCCQEDTLTLGQTIRQKYPDQTFSVGFSTYTGTLTCANSWQAEAKTETLPPALETSHEAVFHQVSPNFLLNLQDTRLPESIHELRPERRIGVIYQPEIPQDNYYLKTEITKQFDSIIHYDHTHPVTPLDKASIHPIADLPDTFPFGV